MADFKPVDENVKAEASMSRAVRKAVTDNASGAGAFVARYHNSGAAEEAAEQQTRERSDMPKREHREHPAQSDAVKRALRQVEADGHRRTGSWSRLFGIILAVVLAVVIIMGAVSFYYFNFMRV